MTVYYGTRQYRLLSRCLQPEQVKTWIRWRNHRSTPLTRKTNAWLGVNQQNPAQPLSKSGLALPSVASVLTVSAPNMLLASALHAFVVGLGIYLGFVWQRHLADEAGPTDNRDIFITYLVGLAFCYGIYTLSGAAAGDDADLDLNVFLAELLLRDVQMQTDLCDEEKAGKDDRQAISPSSRQATSNDSKSAHSTMSLKPGELHIDPRSALGATNNYQELVQAMSKASDLRKKCSEADEKVANLLAQLGSQIGKCSCNQGHSDAVE